MSLGMLDHLKTNGNASMMRLISGLDMENTTETHSGQNMIQMQINTVDPEPLVLEYTR